MFLILGSCSPITGCYLNYEEKVIQKNENYLKKMEDSIVRYSGDISIAMVENEDEMEQDMERHTDFMGIYCPSHNGRSLFLLCLKALCQRMVPKRYETRSQLSFNNMDFSRVNRLPSI